MRTNKRESAAKMVIRLLPVEAARADKVGRGRCSDRDEGGTGGVISVGPLAAIVGCDPDTC